MDGLRGLAIAGVLWHHLVEPYLPLGSSSALGWVRAAGALSWTGVDLFFVLSGYLIGGILLDHRDSPRLTSTFYLRRAARILPLYYVTIAVCLILVAVGFAGSSQLFSEWVYGTFLTNITLAAVNRWDWAPLSVLWSLAVEEQFYLAAPWIIRWIPPLRVPGFLIGLVASAWVLRTSIVWLWPQNYLAHHVLMPARMDTLACGVLVAWLVRQPHYAGLVRRLEPTWGWWLAAAGALFALLTACHYFHLKAVGLYAGYTLIALIYSLVLFIVVAVRPPLIVRVLSSALPVSLGRHAYFLYLWHMLIGWGLLAWLGGPEFQLNSLTGLAIVVAAVGATWLAAIVSWRLFERPFVRLGHRATY